MNIGLVTATYTPVINGVTRTVALHKKYLEEAGHHVTVFSLGKPGADVQNPDTMRSPGLPIGNSGYYFALRYSRHAQDLLSQVDIIHCHHMFMGLEFTHRYGRSPIVYHSHTRIDMYAQYYLRLPEMAARGLMRLLWPGIIGLSDVVVAPSRSVKQLLRGFGVKQPIEVIANGIETELYENPQKQLTREELGLPESNILMIYVGRLANEKNLEKLLLEFSLALSGMPSLHLLLVGSGPSRQRLQKLARTLNIERRVTFYGEVPHAEVPGYLALADFFVTASTSEVLPLTIIEAMATGLPVAAIASPGVDDLILHQSSGILTGSGNGELARAMCFLADDPFERTRFGNNAQLASKHYHIRQKISELIDLYDRLLED